MTDETMDALRVRIALTPYTPPEYAVATYEEVREFVPNCARCGRFVAAYPGGILDPDRRNRIAHRGCVFGPTGRAA